MKSEREREGTHARPSEEGEDDKPRRQLWEVCVDGVGGYSPSCLPYPLTPSNPFKDTDKRGIGIRDIPPTNKAAQYSSKNCPRGHESP